MRIILLLLFVWISTNSFSLETILQGTITSFNEKTIRLYSTDDFVSNKNSLLTKGEISEDKFRLAFDIESPQKIQLKIENKLATLYVEPGEVYNIKLLYDEQANEGLAYFKKMSVQFTFPRPDELNQLIKSFNVDYENFFNEHYQQIILKGAKKKVEAFVIKWEDQLEGYQNKYAKNYIKYNLAYLERINYTSEEALYLKYFKDKSVQYKNAEYFAFFQQLYKKDFEKLALSKSGSQILKNIMIRPDLDECLELISEYKSFSDKKFAELYLLFGLADIFHQSLIDQASSLKMLKLIESNGKNKENKLIARNLIEKLSLFSKTSTAPDFTLANSSGDSVSLSALRGKPVYIGFWANWSLSSRRELAVIKRLFEQYKEDIHFVSINLDDDVSVNSTAVQQNDYQWKMLHIGKKYKLREQYEALSLPAYYLIDANGKMLRAFAKGPTEIQAELHRLSRNP